MSDSELIVAVAQKTGEDSLEIRRWEPVNAGVADGRAGAHLDDLLRLAGFALGFACQSGDLVLHGH